MFGCTSDTIVIFVHSALHVGECHVNLFFKVYFRFLSYLTLKSTDVFYMSMWLEFDCPGWFQLLHLGILMFCFYVFSMFATQEIKRIIKISVYCFKLTNYGKITWICRDIWSLVILELIIKHGNLLGTCHTLQGVDRGLRQPYEYWSCFFHSVWSALDSQFISCCWDIFD